MHSYIHLNISDASYLRKPAVHEVAAARRRAHLVTVSWQITHSIIGERLASALRYARTYAPHGPPACCGDAS